MVDQMDILTALSKAGIILDNGSILADVRVFEGTLTQYDEWDFSTRDVSYSLRNLPTCSQKVCLSSILSHLH